MDLRLNLSRAHRVATVLLMALVVSVGLWAADGPLTNLMNIRVRTNASGYLITTAGAYTGSDGPLTALSNLRGRTDANGYLITTTSGGTETPDKICLDAANQDACLQRNGAGILQVGNAATSTDFARVQFGGSTASFPALKRSATSLQVRLADDSAFAGLTASAVIYSASLTSANALLISATAPTVTSAGSSPSVTFHNGTATFRVNVGTGGTATTIVMALPTATAGWNCQGSNITAAAANRNPTGVLLQQSSTTTAATMQYQTVATGVALAFTASDIVQMSCAAF